VRFKGNIKGLTFMLQTNMAEGFGVAYGGGGSASVHSSVSGYRNICSAPCEVEMNKGIYRLGLLADRRTVDAGKVEIDRPVVVEGHYNDNSAIHWIGFGIGMIGLVAGSVMAFEPLATSEDPNMGMVLGGAGVFIVGITLGAILSFWPDTAELTVRDYK
jgi:hypothetical protein